MALEKLPHESKIVSLRDTFLILRRFENLSVKKTRVFAAFSKNKTIGIAIATVFERERVIVLSHLLSPSSSRTLAHPALSNRRLVFSGRLFFCANSGVFPTASPFQSKLNSCPRNLAIKCVLGYSSTPHFLVNPTTRFLYSCRKHAFDFPLYQASYAI